MILKKILRPLSLSVLGFILLVIGGVDADAQTAAPPSDIVQTLTGRIVWRKSMGVPPSSPGGNTPAENICGSFWVALLINSGTPDSPAAYDNKLERGNDPFMPDYYVCNYSMRAAADRSLLIWVGMGDVFKLPKPAFLPIYYTEPWIDEQGNKQSPPIGRKRVFLQDQKEIRMGRSKGTYLKIELAYR